MASGKTLIARDAHRELATIANGQTKSAAVPTYGYVVLGAVFPAELDGTAVTFEVSIDGTTFFPLYDSTGGAQVSMTVAASRAFDLPTALASWPYLKFVIGTSQTGATTIPVTMKG
jgi:hypothetical protein